MTFDLSGLLELVSMAVSIVSGAAVTVWRVGGVERSMDKLTSTVNATRLEVAGVAERVARMEGAHIREWHPGDD